ncbi:MAG: TIGR00297 family protein [Thermostichales cyanobacterium BF4_bins_65]
MNPWLLALLLNGSLGVLAWFSPQQALTKAGIIHAAILGILVWGGLGWRGYLIVASYFLVGTAVTRLGQSIKEAKGIAEKRGGSRGPENVWGSALTGAICAVGYAIGGQRWWWLGYCASFAAKLADTVSSEVGKAYGQRTFLVTTWQPVPPGTEGAVSLEGSLAGVAAAVGLSGLGWLVGGEDWRWWLMCAGAGIVATFVESWLGVWQERIPGLTNERVNAMQTTLAALIAIALSLAFAR